MFKISNLKQYLPDALNTLLVLLFGVLTYVYFEGLTWFGSTAIQPLSNLNFYLESIVLLIYDFGFLFYSFKYYKVKIRWPFFIVLVVACFFAMIPLWGFPGAIYDGRVVYDINGDLVTRYMLLTFMVFLSIFVFLFVIPNVLKNRKYYRFFMWIAIGVGIYATIYSFFNEAEIYHVLFTDPHSYLKVPKSYTTQRNVYAYICIMAMLADAYLLVEKDYPWRWALFFYFFVCCCFTFSKTCILLGLLIIVAFVPYKVVKMWKTRRIAAISLVSGIAISAVFLAVVSLNEFGGFLGKLHAFTDYLFFELPKFNDGSLETRKYFFEVANDVLGRNAFTRFFGFGYGNWYASYYASYTGNYLNNPPMDIAYAVDMLEFGYPGLVFSFALWTLAMYFVVVQFIDKSKFAHINALMIICFLLRTVTEAGDFAYPNLTGTAYYLILLCPMMAESKTLLSTKNESEQIEMKQNTYIVTRFVTSVITSVLVFASVVFLCLSFRASEGKSIVFMVLSVALMLAGIVSSIASFMVLIKTKKISPDSKEKIFLETAISTIFCVIGWAAPFAILKGNSARLDGMTHTMMVLFAGILMLVVNGLIIIEAFRLKEKDPQKNTKKK